MFKCDLCGKSYRDIQGLTIRKIGGFRELVCADHKIRCWFRERIF